MLPFPSHSYLYLFTVYSHHLPSSSSHPPVEVRVADSTLRGLQLRGCKHVTLRDVRLSNARPLFLHCVPCRLPPTPACTGWEQGQSFQLAPGIGKCFAHFS